MEKPNHVKFMGNLVFLIVVALSLIIIVAVLTKYGKSDMLRMGWPFSPEPQPEVPPLTPSSTVTSQPVAASTSTSTSSTTTTSSTLPAGKKDLRMTDGPRPDYTGKLETNLGRYFVNETIVFNETGGLSRVAGTVRQMVEIDEADLGKYAGEEIYLQYWNGTWTRIQ